MSEAWRAANRERAAGDLEAAARHYRAALVTEPVGAHHHLGFVLAALGRTDEAEALYREAMALCPFFIPAQHSLALLLLSLGRFEEGWRLYEARRLIPELHTPEPRLPFPEWRGEDLRGRRILVYGEQGFGDQIMFARFLAPLRALGAEPTLVCRPGLAPLFPGAIPTDFVGELRRPDYWVLAASLPHLLGASVETLPPPADLGLPPDGGGGTGVMAAGNPGHGYDAIRSLHGADAAALRALGRDLAPEATGARDFLETARLVAGLDRVITVDTAMAHLAGSLGKPTWVLLQGRYSDWRWMRDRADSPWYPSVRLYRQAPGEPWSAVLETVGRDLAVRTGISAAPPAGRG